MQVFFKVCTSQNLVEGMLCYNQCSTGISLIMLLTTKYFIDMFESLNSVIAWAHFGVPQYTWTGWRGGKASMLAMTSCGIGCSYTHEVEIFCFEYK